MLTTARIALSASSRLAAVTGVALYLAGSAVAQSRFEHRLQYSYLPLDQDLTAALAYGDVDGDGDLDVVVGNNSAASLPTQQTRLLLNDGRGALVDVTSARLPVDNDLTTAVRLVDVDADGDLDLVIAKLALQNRLYRNDGSGTFTDVTAQALPVDSARTTAIAVGDTDGDGDVDLVFANSWPSGRQNFLYENDGTGTFVNATAARLPVLLDPTADVALADFDGDGDLDLLTVNGSSFSLDRMMWNDGTGTFSLTGGPALPQLFDHATSVTVADIDGDLDLDYVVGNALDLPSSDGTDRVMVNDGTGSFTDETATRLPYLTERPTDVELRDVDGDLDPDLIMAAYGQNVLFVNDGAGAFTPAATPLPVHEDGSRAVAVLDVDGDGDRDLMFGNLFWGSAEQNRLYVNDGAGGFADATLPRLPIYTTQGRTAVVFDADGDGAPDVLVVNEWSAAHLAQLFRNDGRGVFDFGPVAPFTLATGNVRDAVAGDFDGDGDLDLLLAHGWQEQSRYYTNDGTGSFVEESWRLPVAGDATEAVTAADVDRDGDLDLVLGNHYDTNALYLNNGAGVFLDVSPTHLPLDGDWTGDVAFADVDGDGWLDLIAANEQSQNRLFLNTGTGSFVDVTAARMPADADRSVSVAVGDVDGDGDVDLVFGNSNERQNRLYLNDGSGSFTDATASALPVDDDSTEGIALGDVDGDGDLDLVVANRGPSFQSRLLRNDGNGLFQEEPFDGLKNLATDVVLADVDQDGDLDVVQTNNGEQLLLLNRSRQLTAPVFATVGRAFPLDVELHPGELQQTSVAVPLLALARLPAAVSLAPFGAVWLLPPAFALPAVTLPAPAGTGSATVAIPADASLIGMELHAQALIFDAMQPTTPRLTNLVTAAIRP